MGPDLLGHLAADEDDVGALGEAPEDADLVLDLGAADDRDERPPGTPEQLPELLELALEQEAGVGRKQVRDPLGRGVRTMRRSERVVHVQVGLGGKLLRQCGVVRRLARVEPRVLEHTHAIVGSEQLEQPLGDRRDRIRGVGPLRAAEVRADDDLCRIALEQQAQGRQRRSDAGVVGDAAVL